MTTRLIKSISAAAIISVLLIVSSGCFLKPSTQSATASEVGDGIFTLVNQERVDNGKQPLTRVAWLDELAEDYADSEFSETFAESSNLIYLVCNTWMLDFGSGTPSLDEDTAAEQVDYCLDQQNMHDDLLRQDARETGVGVAIVGSIVYFAQVFDVIYSSGGDGEPIILEENADATDPTWEELIAFLDADDTDDNPYVAGEFICGDFAEMLHNHAEADGIKAAFVSVRLNEEPGHALNAFMVDGTTLVFIDDGNGDSVGYMEIDQRYGTINIDNVASVDDTDYDFFTSYGGTKGYLESANDTVVDFYVHW